MILTHVSIEGKGIDNRKFLLYNYLVDLCTRLNALSLL